MSGTPAATRHPFLDDLGGNVVLTTNVLNEQVEGRDHVLRIIKTGGTLYASQTPTYHQRIDSSRSLFEYDAKLKSGETVHGVVVIDWDSEGAVSHLNIGFAPLSGALAFADGLRVLLQDQQRNREQAAADDKLR